RSRGNVRTERPSASGRPVLATSLFLLARPGEEVGLTLDAVLGGRGAAVTRRRLVGTVGGQVRGARLDLPRPAGAVRRRGAAGRGRGQRGRAFATLAFGQRALFPQSTGYVESFPLQTLRTFPVHPSGAHRVLDQVPRGTRDGRPVALARLGPGPRGEIVRK